MTEAAPRNRTLLRVLILLAPFAIIAASLVIFKEPGTAGHVETPIASVEFPDGYRLEILEAVDATSLEMRSRREFSRWKLVTSSGSSGGSYSNVAFDLRHRNKRFESVTVKLNNDGLILMARLLDPEGLEIVPTISRDARDNALWEAKWDSMDLFEEMEEVPPGKSVEPEFLIEVDGGGGSWIPMSGPLAFEATDGRSFASAPVYSRRSPELHLRIVRHGQDPVELTIPNPGHRPPAGWTVDPKPWSRTLTEAEVELTEIRAYRRSKPWVHVRPVFKVRPLAGEAADAFYCGQVEVTDEWGNLADPHDYPLAPDIDKLRFSGVVRPGSGYKWPASTVTFYAEGAWDGSTSGVDLTILPDGEAIGMIGAKLIPGAPKGSSPSWSVELQGETNRSKYPGSFDTLLFLDAEAVSSCQSRGSSGGSSTNQGVTRYNRTLTIHGPIRTGQKVRFGFLPPSVPESFEFTVPIDAPALIEKAGEKK